MTSLVVLAASGVETAAVWLDQSHGRKWAYYLTSTQTFSAPELWTKRMSPSFPKCLGDDEETQSVREETTQSPRSPRLTRTVPISVVSL